MHRTSSVPASSKFAAAILAALVIAVFAAGAAAAGDSGHVSRDIVVNDVEVEHTINECTGAEGTFTRTFGGLIQTVTRPDGTTLFRGWLRADDATFVPDDPTQPTFIGRELVHVSMVSNRASATVTSSCTSGRPEATARVQRSRRSST